jgi:hypothetical protein
VIACIVLTYLVVLLGAVNIARTFWRDDVDEARRCGWSPPSRLRYVLPAIGWPVIWLVLPIGVLLAGTISTLGDL